MFYVICGNDLNKCHEKFDKLVSSAIKKRGDYSIFRFDEEGFDFDTFKNTFRSECLFGGRNLVIQKRVFADREAKEYIFNNLEEISSSVNLFIFFEEEVKKNDLDFLKRYAEDVWEFNLDRKKEEKKEHLPYFRIADLVAAKRRNEAWLAFQREVFGGIEVEEVFWKIHWQIKNLLIVKSDGGEDLHPFVLGRAKRNADLFKKDDLRILFTNLNNLYYKSRSGAADMEFALEGFILQI